MYDKYVYIYTAYYFWFQVYESEDFYNLADKYGIMIWQDLMFACSMYPVYDEFLTNVKEEVTHQVRF